MNKLCIMTQTMCFWKTRRQYFMSVVLIYFAPFRILGCMMVNLILVYASSTGLGELSGNSALSNSIYAEQDMLNIILKDKWKSIDSQYNIDFRHDDSIVSGELNRPDAIAIHDKWLLREKYKLIQPTWIWNQLMLSLEIQTSFKFVFLFNWKSTLTWSPLILTVKNKWCPILRRGCCWFRNKYTCMCIFGFAV